MPYITPLTNKELKAVEESMEWLLAFVENFTDASGDNEETQRETDKARSCLSRIKGDSLRLC